MNLMIIEIGIGIYIAVIVSMVIIGITPKPLIFAGIVVGVVYFLYTNKNINRNNSFQVTNNSAVHIKFEDIGGQQTAITEIKESIEFLMNKERSQALGIRPLKGLLLSGPPGNGKTLLAKAASRYTDSVFISTSGSEFIEMYAGIGAKRVRKLFSKAKQEASQNNKTSAIIFIDELDVLGAKRGTHGSHMEYDQTLNQLLVEMDGLNSTSQDIDILIMGATNRLDSLDTALIRPGRFDRIVKVNTPDKNGRLEILKIHCQGKPLDPNVKLERLAEETFGFSGAHLESLVNEAAILSLRREKNVIGALELEDALEKVMMGEKLPQKPTDEELTRIAYHEVGHAFIMEKLLPGSVARLAIASRGNALGYTRRGIMRENYLKTKECLENELTFLLAGSRFEAYFLGSRSTGNLDDLDKAFQIASKMIESGMSPLGIVQIDHMAQNKKEETIREIISAMESKIDQIIEENLDVIQLIVDKLLKEEVIAGEELRAFIKGAA